MTSHFINSVFSVPRFLREVWGVEAVNILYLFLWSTYFLYGQLYYFYGQVFHRWSTWYFFYGQRCPECIAPKLKQRWPGVEVGWIMVKLRIATRRTRVVFILHSAHSFPWKPFEKIYILALTPLMILFMTCVWKHIPSVLGIGHEFNSAFQMVSRAHVNTHFKPTETF